MYKKSLLGHHQRLSLSSGNHQVTLDCNLIDLTCREPIQHMWKQSSVKIRMMSNFSLWCKFYKTSKNHQILNKIMVHYSSLIIKLLRFENNEWFFIIFLSQKLIMTHYSPTIMKLLRYENNECFSFFFWKMRLFRANFHPLCCYKCDNSPKLESVRKTMHFYTLSPFFLRSAPLQ